VRSEGCGHQGFMDWYRLVSKRAVRIACCCQTQNRREKGLTFVGSCLKAMSTRHKVTPAVAKLAVTALNTHL
jgi:hypothetical protein